MYRVLIVEDEDIIRKGIAYTMDWPGMGCSIVGEAANGQEGIDKIAELSPDIVMADIMMPVMDGIEMIRTAKSSEDMPAFKSIILTSYADFEYAKKAIDLDVSAYLMKPVDEEELKKAVAKITTELEKERKLEKISENNAMAGNMPTAFIKTDKENDYVQHILDYTKEHYADKISIEAFSEELGVSASYLSRKFKESTGTSFLDFLNKYRVQQAVRLLETGKYKVYEVSDMTGFTDYKHFNTVFKRYTNVSPSEFLKLNG
ncbi:response regulator transcription factor [Butyrivibrio sp. YAB3001]|uniref:response regulator transcription factor n=1 Tax=Butyrivibrio sp. YAB3001 TaxID=1520812 RepID=UPI0008F62785|nr:response regulator [Butyrivibrio sp. YAB3001]SFB75828.1 two-component system, response regulator YesN [Butyrivibrio sp. YAB3001]